MFTKSNKALKVLNKIAFLNTFYNRIKLSGSGTKPRKRLIVKF